MRAHVETDLDAWLDALDRSVWFAPSFVEFVSHGEGVVASVNASSSEFVRQKDGSWIERHTGDDPATLGGELAGASSRHS